MGVHVELKRKITVNGRDYEGLDEIPEEFHAAIQSALASSAVHSEPEPVVSMRMIAAAICLTAALACLARLVF